MTEHLRVSVGNADEMDRFLTGFREIVARPPQSPVGGRSSQP